MLELVSLLCGGIGAIALFLVLARAKSATGHRSDKSESLLSAPRTQVIMTAALLSWSGSYALTLTNYPPTQTLGRLTSTHTAAAWGVAILIGAGYAWLAVRPWVATVRWTLAGAGLIYFVGALSYDQWIQREYARSWSLQRNFWRQVIDLSPEADGGYSILVTGTKFPSSAAILTNSWADHLVCLGLFDDRTNPDPIGFAHLAHLGRNGVKVRFRRDGDTIRWNPEFWNGSESTLNPRKLILLSSDGSTLRRITELPTTVGILRAPPLPSNLMAKPRKSALGKIMFPIRPVGTVSD
jgi:hypothetical protein